MSIKRQQKDLKSYETLFLDTFVPLFLMVTTPIIALLFPYIIVIKNSNLTKTLINQNVLITVQESWASIKWSDLEIWLFILCILIWGIISLHFPGQKYHAPPTPNGFRPTYWHNGFRFYIVSMIISVILIAKYPMIYWYYKVPSLIGILIVTGFVLCLLLYIKGMLHIKSF